MKPVLRLASLVIAQIQRGLNSLNEVLKPWMPQRAPVFKPIPIQRRTHPLDRRFDRQSNRRHARLSD